MLAASILSPQFIAGVIIVIVILCIIGSCIRIVTTGTCCYRRASWRLSYYMVSWCSYQDAIC